MEHNAILRLLFAVLIAAQCTIQLAWRVYYRTQPGTKKVDGAGEVGVLVAMPLWALSVLLYPFNFEWFDISASLPSWMRWCGVMGMVLCLPLSVWIFESLGSNFSPTLRLTDDHRLVSSGPYRFVRHPMYATFFLCALSATFISANLVIALTSAAAITALTLRIKKEEAMLLERFGERYVDYTKKTGAIVPKWFPF